MIYFMLSQVLEDKLECQDFLSNISGGLGDYPSFLVNKFLYSNSLMMSWPNNREWAMLLLMMMSCWWCCWWWWIHWFYDDDESMMMVMNSLIMFFLWFIEREMNMMLQSNLYEDSEVDLRSTFKIYYEMKGKFKPTSYFFW